MKHLVYNSFGILFLSFTFTVCGQRGDSFQALRNRMVQAQIEARGITGENILKAFRKVERHRFVPPEYLPYAYSDTPLPIEEGQTISQPYIVALMTEVLNLKKSDKVLEVGTGSGYQAAILAELCDSVFTVEIFETLAKNASALFNELGYTNIHSKTGDGYMGWSEHAPFDAIIVTCAPSKIPEPLQNQLAEGGRMVIPTGTFPVQNLILMKKRKGRCTKERILPVRFVPMIDSKGNEY